MMKNYIPLSTLDSYSTSPFDTILSHILQHHAPSTTFGCYPGIMKRKRELVETGSADSAMLKEPPVGAKSIAANFSITKASGTISIQIVAGSYDRVLHGLTATLSRPAQVRNASFSTVQFSDNFLFHAHSSAIRCLAISPLPSPGDATSSHKLILASGSTDERINLYHISAYAKSSSRARGDPLPSLAGTSKEENPKNRELGSLLHHSSTVTALHFPSRSKLLSGAEDNTIAVCRSRDWTVLSTFKAPIPKALGRPSGDTAPPSTLR